MLKIEQDTDEFMRKLADYIKSKIGNKFGFALIVFPYGDGRSQRVGHYISDSRREDMIKALREQADSLERGLDISSLHMIGTKQ